LDFLRIHVVGLRGQRGSCAPHRRRSDTVKRWYRRFAAAAPIPRSSPTSCHVASAWSRIHSRRDCTGDSLDTALARAARRARRFGEGSAAVVSAWPRRAVRGTAEPTLGSSRRIRLATLRRAIVPVHALSSASEEALQPRSPRSASTRHSWTTSSIHDSVHPPRRRRDTWPRKVRRRSRNR